MPQLDVFTFPSQLFWLCVCFLALYLIIRFIAAPKIAQSLEVREEAINEKLNQASTYREQAESLLADYEATLAQAREQAQQHYKAATRAITSELSQKQKDLHDKINDHLHLAEQKLYRERIEASKEIKTVAADLASTILEKITGHKYKPEDLFDNKEET